MVAVYFRMLLGLGSCDMGRIMYSLGGRFGPFFTSLCFFI